MTAASLAFPGWIRDPVIMVDCALPRMAQAKRSQVDGRVNRAIFWALLLGALLILAIHLLVNYTG